ncbi:MAG: ferric reductase-like transmembrane domain-containing protein [Nocardioidaceae bacterium]
MTSPLLWFANRGTGVVLLLLLTLTALLGVLATRGHAGRGVPRFLTQSLHRNLSLVAVGLLVAHVGSAVLDEYVDIRWWQALVPVGATYRPLWLELGTLALDVVVVVAATSLLRHRLPHRAWRAVHVLAYLAFAAALAHGVGIGTDASSPWGRRVSIGCAGAVALAAGLRLAALAWTARRHPPVPAHSARAVAR